MRTNATLAVEQVKASVTPYIRLEYYDSGWIDLSSRIVDLKAFEEPYSCKGVFILDNSDGGLSSISFKKKMLRVGRGLVCAGAPQVSYMAELKCKRARKISHPKSVLLVLTCYGVMDRLAGWSVDDPYGYIFNDTDDVHTAIEGTNETNDCIGVILSKAGIPAMSIVSQDEKFSTWQPKFTVEPGELGRDIIRWLLQRTTSVVLKPSTNTLAAILLSDEDPLVTYVTISDGVHQACHISEVNNEVFYPMKATVENGTNSGDYTHDDWVEGDGVLAYLDGLSVTASDADCDWLAEAMVKRAEGEADSGLIQLGNIDCLLELYDRVTVDDQRGDADFLAGRVGYIYFHFSPRQKICSMSVGIGGLARNLGDTPAEILDGTGIISPPKKASPVIPWDDIPAEIYYSAMQPFVSNLTWTSAGVDQATWSTDNIEFADGTHITLTGGTKTSLTTSPVYAFFDLEVSETAMQFSSSIAATAGRRRGLLAVLLAGATGTTKAVVLTNAGKQPILNAVLIQCDALAALSAVLGNVSVGGANGMLTMFGTGITLKDSSGNTVGYIEGNATNGVYLYSYTGKKVCIVSADNQVRILAGLGLDLSYTPLLIDRDTEGPQTAIAEGELKAKYNDSKSYLTYSDPTGGQRSVRLGPYGAVMPRRVTQADGPTPEVGEAMFWRDSDDGVIYLCYNDVTTGIKKVALTV